MARGVQKHTGGSFLLRSALEGRCSPAKVAGDVPSDGAGGSLFAHPTPRSQVFNPTNS